MNTFDVKACTGSNPLEGFLNIFFKKSAYKIKKKPAGGIRTGDSTERSPLNYFP